MANEVGVHYRRGRERLTDLLSGIDDEAWRTPVAACPGWRVQDVLGHLVGIIEDVNAGVLTGPPTEAQTAVQVERHRDGRPAELLARWSDLAEPFEKLIGDIEVWPPAYDVVAHEQDIRSALSRPGARDDELILRGARQMFEGLDLGATVSIDLGDETIETVAKQGSTYRLRTTPFEVFRFRLGRRSRDQVLALDWSPVPPGEVVDQLFMFGPAEAPLIE